MDAAPSFKESNFAISENILIWNISYMKPPIVCSMVRNTRVCKWIFWAFSWQISKVVNHDIWSWSYSPAFYDSSHSFCGTTVIQSGKFLKFFKGSFQRKEHIWKCLKLKKTPLKRVCCYVQNDLKLTWNWPKIGQKLTWNWPKIDLELHESDLKVT